MSYSENKARARKLAIEWQTIQSEKSLSYNEIIMVTDVLSRLAKQYGLIKEFKENGII